MFDDIFQQFRAFFFKKKFYNSPFYYEVAFLFLPRIYQKGVTIIKKGDEFHEILLQTEGELKGVLQSDPQVEWFFNKGFFLGDFEVIYNRRSILTYQTTGPVKFLALPKHKFLKILNKYPEILKEMKDNTMDLRKMQENRFVGTCHLEKETDGVTEETEP